MVVIELIDWLAPQWLNTNTPAHHLDDISRFHWELTDVLWEFDDYISVETFDASKYAQIQSLCRSVAPRLYNVLVTVNLELLAQKSTEETPLHIKLESPPTSISYSSRSTEAWHPFPSQRHSERDPSLLRIVDSGTHEKIYPTSAPSLDMAQASMTRQSYSSGCSSPSSGCRSGRGSAPRSIIPIRAGEERPRLPSQSWPRPEDVSNDAASQRVCDDYAPDHLRSRDTFEHAAVPWRLPSKNCIITDSSSFRRYKGFCSGAHEVLQGKDGVKQKQKPVQRTLSRVVAKCTGCSMELDYDGIETDLANKGDDVS